MAELSGIMNYDNCSLKKWFKLYHLPTDILCSGSAIPQPGEKKYDKEMSGPGTSSV